MTKVLILIAISAWLTSCQSDSNAKPITPEQALKFETEKILAAPAATDVTQTIKPDRIQVVKANLTYDEQKEMRTIGCKNLANGGYTTDYQLDRELTVGSTFRTEGADHELLGRENNSSSVDTIKEIRPDFIATETNFEFLSFSGTPFTSMDQIFLQRPHYIFEKTYTFQGDDYPSVNFDAGDYMKNFTAAAKDWLRADFLQNPTEWSCDIQYQDATYTSTVAKIAYNIMGRPTEAFLTDSTSASEVVCEKRDRVNFDNPEIPDYQKEPLARVKLGPGKKVQKTIVSNKFISDGLVTCGGEELFRSSVLTLDSGKVINSSVDKTVEAPFRTRQ